MYASASACASGETRARRVSAWPIAPPFVPLPFDAGDHPDESGRHRDDDRCRRSATGRRALTRERGEEVAKRGVQQVGHGAESKPKPQDKAFARLDEQEIGS